MTYLETGCVPSAPYIRTHAFYATLTAHMPRAPVEFGQHHSRQERSLQERNYLIDLVLTFKTPPARTLFMRMC